MLARIITTSLLFVSGTCGAHHSFATHYDTQNIIEIQGVLSDVKMRNPHSFFEVEVANDAGETETWEVEAHAVPILRRLGISKDTLKVGDEIMFRGPRSRRPDKNLLFGAQIETASGEQFEMLSSIRQAPEYENVNNRDDAAGVDRMIGKWMTFITGQRVSESPMPLNAAGKEARANFNPAINSSSECVPSNLPSLLMIPYIYEITRDGDTINIFHEYSRIWRPVILGSPLATMTDPSFGKRIARFEDNTLVIESDGFPALSAGLASGWEPNGNGADIPSSEQKELIERYSLSADGSQLAVEYTVIDPAYLTEPYTGTVTWHRMPDDSQIYDFKCDAEIAKRSTSNAALVER